MNDERLSEIVNRIQKSDNVLIGMGEEMELNDSSILMYCKEYSKCLSYILELSKEQKMWVDKCFVYHEIINKSESVQKHIEYYNKIYELIKYKNYFVVTTCHDGLIEFSSLEDSNIVEPCGNLFQMQCSDNCCNEVYSAKGSLQNIYNKIIDNSISNEEIIPKCSKCGKPMMINIKYRDTKNYCETGYMPKWKVYRQWLQNTLNRDIVVLELGVGFDTPTVIRWPFEKIAFINHKAYMIRVNEICYQVAEGLSNKAMGINSRANEFLKELFR